MLGRRSHGIWLSLGRSYARRTSPFGRFLLFLLFLILALSVVQGDTSEVRFCTRWALPEVLSDGDSCVYGNVELGFTTMGPYIPASSGVNWLGWAGLGANLAGAFWPRGGGTGSVNYNRDMIQRDSRDYAAWVNQMQIRTRDAKAAGLHPLFALGAAGGNTFTASAPGGGQSGSQFGNRLQRIGLQLEAMQRRADIRKTESERMLLDSQRMRINQSLNYTRPPLGPGAGEKVVYTHVKGRNPWTGEDNWYPNPDLFETPETLGAAMYGQGKLQDPDVLRAKAKRAKIAEHKRYYKWERARRRALASPGEVLF